MAWFTARNDAEAKLRAAIWTGRLVDLRTKDTTADDPVQGAGWPAKRTVPAALLGTRLEQAVPLRAIRIGAAILFLIAAFITAINALRLV